MTYYTRIKKDKYREKHLNEMERIQFKMSMYFFDVKTYKMLQIKLLKMERQLKLYDKVMGYKLEL